MNLFGPIVTANTVEQIAAAHLREWLPTYLAEMERQTDKDPGVLQPPKSVVTANEFDKWPEDKLPCLLLICPGLAERPIRDGDGEYRCRWAVAAAVIVKANGRQEVRQLSQIYIAAVRAALLQRAGWGDERGMGVEWIEERNDDVPTERSRFLAAGQFVCSYEMTAVLNAYGGPNEPLEEPLEDPGDWDTFASTLVSVENTTEENP